MQDMLKKKKYSQSWYDVPVIHSYLLIIANNQDGFDDPTN